jgi:hypothetical protein
VEAHPVSANAGVALALQDHAPVIQDHQDVLLAGFVPLSVHIFLSLKKLLVAALPIRARLR